jgi:hypothetical protein
LKRNDPGKKRALVACSIVNESISTLRQWLCKNHRMCRVTNVVTRRSLLHAPLSNTTHNKTLSVATSGYQWRRLGKCWGVHQMARRLVGN